MGDQTDHAEDEAPLDLNNPPFPLTAIDREILATQDEDYHKTTWEDLENIVGMIDEPCTHHLVLSRNQRKIA